MKLLANFFRLFRRRKPHPAYDIPLSHAESDFMSPASIAADNERIRERAAHIEWCKERALRRLAEAGCQAGFNSMLVDMGKNPMTENHLGVTLIAFGMIQSGDVNDPKKVSDFIEGFH